MTEEELRALVRDLELDVAILEQEVEILKKAPAPARRPSRAVRRPPSPRPQGPLRPARRAAQAGAGALDLLLPRGAPLGAGRVHAEPRRGEGAPQRARGAASLDPARPVVVSEKVVRRLMREEGLAAASSASRARRYSSYKGEDGMAVAPNLLPLDASRDLHEFRAPAPGLAFSTDITEFRRPAAPGSCTCRP